MSMLILAITFHNRGRDMMSMLILVVVVALAVRFGPGFLGGIGRGAAEFKRGLSDFEGQIDDGGPPKGKSPSDPE